MDEVEMLAKIMSKKDIQTLAKEYGMDKVKLWVDSLLMDVALQNTIILLGLILLLMMLMKDTTVANLEAVIN